MGGVGVSWGWWGVRRGGWHCQWEFMWVYVVGFLGGLLSFIFVFFLDQGVGVWGEDCVG